MRTHKSIFGYFIVFFALFSADTQSSDSVHSKGLSADTSPPKSGSAEGQINKQQNLPKAPAPQSTPDKANENKSTWTAENRKAGTITLKPLNVNLTALTFGMKRKDQQVNGIALNGYRGSFPGILSNRTDRASIGYDLELGVMATESIEAFTILGIARETGIKSVFVAAPPFVPFNLNDMIFDFKPRLSFQCSLGGRYYWNNQKPWFPFIGIMGTATFQGAVKTERYAIANPLLGTLADMGPLTLQKRKILYGGTLQAGADYQFNAYTALTLSIGLRYTPRTRITYTFLPEQPVSFRDNPNLWSVPIMAALKFTF